jgi:hypothetical protein
MRRHNARAVKGGLFLLGFTAACLPEAEIESIDLVTVHGEITSGSTYVLRAAHSAKCVDVAGVSKADGARVHQWTCHGRANQQWTFRSSGGAWEILSVNSGKCLDAGPASPTNGGPAQQRACNGGSAQRWTLSNTNGSGPSQIRSVASGRCLDVANVSSADGAAIQQWACGGGNNQLFTFNTPGGSPGAGSGGSNGGNPGSGGTGGSGGSGGGGGGGSGGNPCDAPGLVWKTGNKTHYTSYPDPGSSECTEYNGCMWAGQFAACSGKKPESWVASRNIVAFFPNFGGMRLHDICLRSGNKTMVATVLDTCGDSDCNGCCTRNRGDADALIDLEHYTNQRWGLPDGRLQWADLGPTRGSGCQ